MVGLNNEQMWLYSIYLQKKAEEMHCLINERIIYCTSGSFCILIHIYADHSWILKHNTGGTDIVTVNKILNAYILKHFTCL